MAVDLLPEAPACRPTGKAVTTYQPDDTAEGTGEQPEDGGADSQRG